jgi:hypothetical protein
MAMSNSTLQVLRPLERDVSSSLEELMATLSALELMLANAHLLPSMLITLL